MCLYRLIRRKLHAAEGAAATGHNALWWSEKCIYDACHAATSTQSVKSVGCCQVEETARRMGHAARGHVKQKFSRQAFGVQLNAIMTDMCQQ